MLDLCLSSLTDAAEFYEGREGRSVGRICSTIVKMCDKWGVAFGVIGRVVDCEKNEVASYAAQYVRTHILPPLHPRMSGKSFLKRPRR